MQMRMDILANHHRNHDHHNYDHNHDYNDDNYDYNENRQRADPAYGSEDRQINNSSERARSIIPDRTSGSTANRVGFEFFKHTTNRLDADVRDKDPRSIFGFGAAGDGNDPDQRSDLSSIVDLDLDRDALEMGSIASDDNILNDDEETGLTSHQRRKQWRLRKRQRREVESQAGDGNGGGGVAGLAGIQLADKKVMQNLGVNVVFILLWYFFAVSISLYNRWMFSPKNLDFKFPLFTTSLHMAVQFTLAATILYFFPSLRPVSSSSSSSSTSQYSPAGQTPNTKSVITFIFYLTRLVPCGSATSLDIGLGNMSLRFISLTFLTMCKSSALGFVLLFAFLFRLETPSLKLVFIICTMAIGVVMMAADEETFDALGFALVIASAFFSGFRWGLTQILLLRHPATANPFSTLFLLTPIMFATLVVIALSVEGPREIFDGIEKLAGVYGFSTIGILVFPGILAFCMISAEFALLKRSSVVTLSICGIFKEVVTIAAAGMLYDEQLTMINIFGLIVTLSSIACYNYIKIKKMRLEAQMDVAESDDRIYPESDNDDGDFGQAEPRRASPSLTQRQSILSRLANTFGLGSTGKYQPIYNPSPEPDPFISQLSGAGGSGNDGIADPIDDDNNIPTVSPDARGRGSVRARIGGSVGSFPTLHSGPTPGLSTFETTHGGPSRQRSPAKKDRSQSRSRPRTKSPERWNR